MTCATENKFAEPANLTKGHQLCALLTISGHAAYTLENVPDGNYRDRITTALSNVLELAESLAVDLLIHAEANPGEENGGEA